MRDMSGMVMISEREGFEAFARRPSCAKILPMSVIALVSVLQHSDDCVQATRDQRISASSRALVLIPSRREIIL